jgi:hypothetical protein
MLGIRWDTYQILVSCQRQRVLTLGKVVSQIFGSLVDLQKSKKVDCPISFSTVERFTMPYCFSSHLLSLLTLKVMINFVVNTTVLVQVLLNYAVTAKPPAVRPAMLTMIESTSYQNQFKV